MAKAVAVAKPPPGRNTVSVVNRMLQDIDRRRTAGGIETLAVHADIRSVAAQPSEFSRTGPRAWIVALIMATCVAAVFVWREWRAQSLPGAVPQAIVATQAPATVQGVSRPAGPPSVHVIESAAPPSAAVAEVSATVAALSEKQAARPPSEQQNVVPVPTEKLKLSMQLSAQLAEIPPARLPAKSASSAPVTAPSTTTVTNVPVRQVATDETIAAVRALWNGGSRTGALATLRDALATAEAARNDRATAPLARELARLEVADNRAQGALDLLRRLENLLGDDADAWALRGNAEQRLAMHAEATQSYLAALRMRPTEGKWMLGAAISLAASGKLDEAQTWVERARERDAITPTIATYLQQLGIVARR